MDTVRRLAWSVEHTVCKIFMNSTFVLHLIHLSFARHGVNIDKKKIFNLLRQQQKLTIIDTKLKTPQCCK